MKMDLILETISFLLKEGFTRTTDEICQYSRNADLYYKKIGLEKYVVFNHYNKDKKEEFQGFDVWVSKYKSDKAIGKEKHNGNDSVVLSFKLERDKTLILKIINEKS